jgi:8-oxo-dGTP pyrophosphatase MutT (NUDIX family)
MKKVTICSWLLIDDRGRILLIKRKFNKKEFPNYWSFPWGRQEEWENINEVVIREVREEVWLDFEITEMFVKDWQYNYFYRFLWSYSWKIILQEEECDGYGWFSYKETENLLTHLTVKFQIKLIFLNLNPPKNEEPSSRSRESALAFFP